MIRHPVLRRILAFIAAVVIATIGGAIVQTQFNLASLSDIGVEITTGQRLQTTFGDIASRFTPTYGLYVVVPSLLVAFIAASLIVRRQPRRALLWYALAGGVAILLGNPVVNYLAPVALLVGATRDVACLVGLSLCGALAGAVFGRMRSPGHHTHHREPRTRPVLHS